MGGGTLMGFHPNVSHTYQLHNEKEQLVVLQLEKLVLVYSLLPHPTQIFPRVKGTDMYILFLFLSQILQSLTEST